MPRVVIGLLKVNKQNFVGNAANRMAEFSLSAQQANSALKALQGNAGGVRMLIAPEYYWSGYGTIGQSRPQDGPLVMSRGDKHDIYSGLKKISRQAGSLVIVAGSVFYRKKESGTNFTAYSVCPVMRNGSFLLKSYKDMDDGAASKNSPSNNYDSKASAPYFKVDGVGFGIEICGDHTMTAGGGGRLAHWNAVAQKTIDVQILVSDGQSPQRNSVVARQGGYLVQCDIGGSAASIRVFPAGGAYNQTTAVPASATTGAQVNGASIYMYVLNV